MKKRFPTLLLVSTATIGLTVGFSNWVINVALFDAGETSKASEAIAYIQNFSSNTFRYFTTIEGALNKAVSGEMVVAIPPTDSSYYPTDTDDRRAASERKTINWNSLSTGKASYTITRNCTIKAGVTFVLPNDDIKTTVTSASTLSTYIENMKNGTKKDTYDGILYCKDENGYYLARSGSSNYTYTQVASKDKATALYAFHKGYAVSHENVFLRTTVNIASGVTLYNDGSLVVSGLLSQGNSSTGIIGQTSHSYSKIALGANAQIIQEGSAPKTYCFGYITESTLNNGSKVDFKKGTLYIPFVVDDYRGFSFSWAMTDGAITSQRCSPFNQIEFCNISADSLIRYGTTVYGIVNNMVIYDTQSINKSFMKEINLIGSTSSSAFQLTDSTYSIIDYKVNPNTQIAKINAIGGLKINAITDLEFQESIVDVNLSTTEAFFPISYRWDITLTKASAQTTASFDTTGQRIKLLPGSSLLIGDGCTLSGNAIVVYSAFYDGTLGNGLNSKTGSGSNYPLKDGATLKVSSEGHLSSNSLAGKVYGSSSNITSTTNQITSKEAWTIISKTNSINPPWTIGDYLEIRETLDVSPLADFSKSKVFVGLNTFTNYSSYVPALNLIANPDDSATTSTVAVSNYQKVALFDTIANYRVNFVSNVSSSYYYATYYNKNQIVTYSTTNNKFGAISSVESISNNNSGVNEFNAQSLTVTCATPLVSGQIPLYIGKSVAMNADVVDISKVYNKTITWTSSDTNVATVNSTGSVTGVALGSVTITATCDGISGSMALQVIEEPTIAQITSIYITDSNGNSSLTTAGTSSFDTSGSSQPYNGKYGNNQSITFTLNINPSGAPYKSILWSFKGTGATRNYLGDTPADSGTASNVTSVVVHTLSGTNASDDKLTLTCTVKDLNDQVFTATFILNHQADLGGCIVKGTLITLADGTQKPVEEIKAGDSLLVFNHETGKLDSSKVVFNDSDPLNYNDVIYCQFSNGSLVKVTTEHGFFNVEENKYLYITKANFFLYIGKHFATFDEKGNKVVVTLSDAFVKKELVKVYSPVTAITLDYFTEGMLSMPGGIPGMFNIFEYDPETLQFDQAKKKADIEKYGLLTLDDFQGCINQYVFDVFNGQYLAVAIGKGNITWEKIAALAQRYGPLC